MFIAIFLVSGEIMLRIAFLNGESFGARAGPIVAKFEKDFVFNRFDGPSRGPEAGEQATHRLLVQGDSITWGQGVRSERDLFTTQLLARLREVEPAAGMDVLAYPGREIDGHLDQLSRWGEALSPDTIVYVWYVNDIELDKSLRPGAKSRPWRSLFLHPTLSRHSYLWFFVDFSLGNLLTTSGSYEQHLLQHYHAGSDAWRRFEEEFLEWARLADQLADRVVITLYPHLTLEVGSRPEMASDIAEIYDSMLRLCMSVGFRCLDLTEPLTRAFEDARTMRAGAFDNHPSADVHQVIAELLFEELRSAP